MANKWANTCRSCGTPVNPGASWCGEACERYPVASVEDAYQAKFRQERERSIRAAIQDDDPDLGEKVAAYDASVEWVARGYADPRISFEAGAAWQRDRHSPPCQCGETLPGPCVSRYPFGHNSRKCEPYVMPRMYDASDGEEQTL